jgi:alpha-tubulin suppressor-like RCC1 family protein
MKKRRLLSLSAVAGALGVAACTALIGIEDLKLKPPVNTNEVAFGAVLCGSTGSPQTVTLSNPSESTYSWSARLERGTSSPFDFEPKSGVLPAGQKVTIVITPDPIAADASPEVREDTLTIVTDLAGDTPHAIRVIETAGVPKLVVTPGDDLTPRDYPVGAFNRAGTITVANQGNAAANVTFDGGGAIRVTPENGKVEANASAVFELAVSPDIGDASLALGVYGGAECVPSTTIIVPGNGVLTGASAIQSGTHTCALVGDRVACWGSNSVGQITEENKGPSRFYQTPTMVPGLRGVKGVTTGSSHTCAVLEDKSVWCWGSNERGQLGRGSIGTASSTGIPGRAANPVGGTLDAVAVSAGAFHTCALSSAGTVYCWGYNFYGSLGNASVVDTGTPVQVVGLTDATQISAGDYTNCALRANKTVVCWGNSGNGQTGDGTTGDGGRTFTPVPVLAANGGAGLLQNVNVIENGASHACALLATGHLACWGANNYGEVGRWPATTTSSVLRPVLYQPVDAEAPYAGFAALGHHRMGSTSCAILTSGVVACWGLTTARGGPGGTLSPVATAVYFDGGPLGDIVSVNGGGTTMCALQDGGSVYCWGSGSSYQTGNGTTTTLSQSSAKVIGFP